MTVLSGVVVDGGFVVVGGLVMDGPVIVGLLMGGRVTDGAVGSGIVAVSGGFVSVIVVEDAVGAGPVDDEVVRSGSPATSPPAADVAPTWSSATGRSSSSPPLLRTEGAATNVDVAPVTPPADPPADPTLSVPPPA
ncbi:MAG: hypothetical protein AAGA65_05100 [Actinomycetota bacterium]